MTTALQPQEDTMSKKDFQAVTMQSASAVGSLALSLNTFAEIEKFAHFMAISRFVPKHLRGQQADCLAVLLQSLRWEMDPFAVAQKTYFVNDGMGYEAQLVNSVVLSRAPLKGRLKLKWDGQGEDMTCTVSGTFKGEDEPAEFTAEMKTITTRNSPNWKQQPKIQLGYYATRAWARLFCPDVLLGVYTPEERESMTVNHYGADNAKDVTPPSESSVIANINKRAQAAKTADDVAEAKIETPATNFDTETGEIIEDGAESGEGAPTDNAETSDAQEVSEFNLTTQAGTTQAVNALLKRLDATPQEQRSSAFASFGGSELLEAMGRHGLGAKKRLISQRGIALPA